MQMMKDRSLEKHPIFPYIAWGLCIGFAYFVYTLTLELKAVQAELAAQTEFLEISAATNPTDISTFTPPID